ncbi:MAG: HAD family hydrolase [Syntrophomonadaceae bacterium]|jgi:FMN phosphatase YigB (HAD superfamily)
MLYNRVDSGAGTGKDVMLVLEVISFDFWNTLYVQEQREQLDSLRANHVKKVLDANGCYYTIEELRMAFYSAWEKAAYFQRAYGLEIGPLGHLQIIQDKLAIGLEDAVQRELLKAYTETLLSVPPQLNGGVKEILPLLSQRFQLAVICNTGASPGYVLRQVMVQDQIARYFKVMVFSDEVGYAKPHPEIFKLVLQSLNRSGKQAAHIGDDPVTDVIGAKQAGMQAIWLAPGAETATPEADHHLRKVKDLLTILD